MLCSRCGDTLGGGWSEPWREGPEARVCQLPGSLLSPQQRARVSQQELRYLWVWVSLSATESVQEVLLEGHPSWKYLKEVHTLLLDVQQSLRVSCAEVREAACAHACGGQGRLRGDERQAWPVPCWGQEMPRALSLWLWDPGQVYDLSGLVSGGSFWRRAEEA